MCLSYFSIALKRYHDQGSLIEDFSGRLAYINFRGLESKTIVARSITVDESLCLDSQVAGRETGRDTKTYRHREKNWVERETGVKEDRDCHGFLKPLSLQTHSSSNKAKSPHPSQTLSLTRNQGDHSHSPHQSGATLLGPSTVVTNQENASTDLPTIWWKHFVSLGFLFSQVILVCVKLTKPSQIKNSKTSRTANQAKTLHFLGSHSFFCFLFFFSKIFKKM